MTDPIINIAIVPFNGTGTPLMVIGTLSGKGLSVYDRNLLDQILSLAEKIDKWPYAPQSHPYDFKQVVEDVYNGAVLRKDTK